MLVVALVSGGKDSCQALGLAMATVGLLDRKSVV